MSVNSRFQQKVQFQRPNPQTTMPNQTNSAKLFTCPKCHRLYDYQLRGNVYVGRVPLILNCEHTICEECVRQTFMKKDVVCGECHTTSPLPWGDLKKKFQERFPVNYYLFGLLSYSKSNGYDISNVSFKPANRSRFSPFELKAEVHTPNMTQECSQRNCQRPAQVHCSECDEVYCDSCSDTLHKSARGLMKHKINPLNLLYYPELKTYCNRHKEALLEFHCETCVEYMCCYCIIEDHKDHEYVRVTQLKEEEIPAFKTLVDAAEEMLRKLKATEKKCNQLLSTHSSTPTNNSIDTLISRCFENLHAALQILEKDLRKDADTYKNINYVTLKSILGEVTTSCHSLSQLIQSAREVIDSKHQVNKLNVKVIKDLLQNSLKVPCFIVTEKQSSQNIEFICGNLLNDLKDNFSIKSDKKCPYYLVTADDLPADYDTEEVSDTGSSSMFSLGVTSQTGSSGLENALEKWNQHAKPFNKNKESIESWLKNTRDSKEQRDVEMPILKKADRMSVVVTHINSPECFYVHLRKMSGVLNKFSKNIDVYIKSFPPNANDPDIGNLYIVKYATKSNIQWCRGRIIDKNEKGLYTAFFVDYGNTATNIRKQDIKTISPELQIPPPFALECKLFDLYPVRHKWDPNVMNIMAHIISSNNLLMIVMDNVNNLLEVDILAIDGDTSLRDALKFMGYGRPYMTTPTELDLIKEEFRTIHDTQLQKHNENFKKEDSVMVVIKYVINPFNIYVNMCHSQSLFNNLKEAMQKFYTEHKKGYIYTPKKDMVVAVLNNDTWFRGIILEATEGRGLVIVYLVDVGNTISVAWQYMRKLNESFIALECQAILVKLAHISPPNNTSNWSQTSIDYFNRFIETGATLKMTVCATGKPIEIALFECFPSMNMCINAILVQEQLAESTGILSTTVEWPEYLKEMQQTETKSFTLEMMKTIQSSSSRQSFDLVEDSDEEQLENVVRKPVEVISAENPNLIYVRLVDKKREQHEFNLKLQNYYSKRCLDKSDWKSGDVCVVFQERQYYRAIVLEALPRDHFRVSLRDVVVEMVVSKNNMGILHDEFKVFHEFAVRCHLAGINPAGGTKKWPAITCEFLQDTFKNQQQFLLAKNGILDKDNKSLPVTMWYTEFIPGGPLESSKTILHSINKLLLSNGLALKTREPEKEIVKYVPEEKSPKQEIPPDVKVDWIELFEEEKNKKVVLQEPKDWLPCIPFKEKNFFATPTFVNNEGEIYLHETMYDTLLSNMESKMGDSFKNTKPEPVVWTVGQLCTAKYFLNGNWYRGKIIENNGNSLKVLMIDYGNEEDCVPDDLRTTLLFEDVPAFANRVRLNNVYPKHGKWQTSDLDRLHAQVVDKNINVVLTETPILGKATPAVLYLGITNVNELMLKNSSNLSAEVVHYPKMPHVLQDINDLSNNNKFNDDAALDIQQMNDSLSDSDVIIEEENYVMSQDEEATADDSVDMIQEVNMQELVQFEMNEIEDDNLTYVQADLPKVSEGEKLQVGIINFVTYNKVIFECSSPENCEKEKFLFEVISNEIKNEAALQPVLENLQVGMPCVAQFSDDGEWYRAKIFDVDDNLINVWFVDFGNFEDVPIGLIRSTKPSWLKVPVEHHLATVSDIQLADASNLEMVLDNMSSYYNTIKRVEIVSRQPLSVRIYDRDTEQLSYKNLLDDGLLTLM